MSALFSKVLPLVLAHEGGYVNHPEDPGGATMKGITQAVYDSYRRNRGMPTQWVKHISRSEIQDIYKRQFWDMCNADDLPAGLDYAVFDYAVNSGANRAVKDLQRTVGARVDGQVGEETIRLSKEAANRDEKKLIDDFCARRMRFLRSLKTWKTFGRGWSRRVVGDFDGYQSGDKGVIDYATNMALEDLTFPIPQAELPRAIGVKEGEEAGKGEESSVVITKTGAGIGSIITASGVSGQTVMSAAQQVQPHINETFFGKIAFVVFLLMMLAGGALLAYTFYARLKEKGAI